MTLDRVSFFPFHVFPTCVSCLLEGEGNGFVDVDLSSFLSSFFPSLSFFGCPSLSRYDALAMSRRYVRLFGCFLDEKGTVDGLLLRGIYRLPALSDD